MTNFNLSARPNVKLGIEMSEYCAEARRLRCTVADIRTVDEVESAGSGFLSLSKRPKILFEGHIFYAEMKKLGFAQKAAELEPSVCYRNWTTRYYVGREGEYGRLARATELCHRFGVDDDAALKSASWGRYQILASNYKLSGFKSVEDFVEAMYLDEANHLTAFAAYLKNTNLDDELRDHEWRLFARGYNGPAYERNKYHIKLPNAWKKFSKQSIDCSSLLSEMKKLHAVDVMPGERDANPDITGFANTSLDERYLSEQNRAAESSSSSSISGADAAAGVRTGSEPVDAGTGSEKASAADNIQARPEGDVVQQTTVEGDKSEEKKLDAAAQSDPVTMPQPEKLNFWAKFTGVLGGIFTGTYAIPKLDLSDAQLELFKALIPYLAIGSLLALAFWYYTKSTNQQKTAQFVAATNADLTKRDIEVVPHPPATGVVASISNAAKAFVATMLAVLIVSLF